MGLVNFAALSVGTDSVNFAAIFLAMASFIFTLYQWLVTVRLKRPNLKLIFFEIKKAFVNTEFRVLKLKLKDFMLSNLSDLPNSIVRIKVKFWMGKCWQDGVLTWTQEVEKMETRQRAVPKAGGGFDNIVINEVVKRIEDVSPYPLIIDGHISRSLANYNIQCSFAQAPSAKELERFNVRVELIDQYNKSHTFYFQRKNLQPFTSIEVPKFPADAQVFGHVAYRNAAGNPYEIFYATFVKNDKEPGLSNLVFHRCSKWEMNLAMSYNIATFKGHLQEDPNRTHVEYNLTSNEETIWEGDKYHTVRWSVVFDFIVKDKKLHEVEMKISPSEGTPIIQRLAIPKAFTDLIN